MVWGKWLQPNLVLKDTILGLTPEQVQQYQLRGLILDVDETLVPFHRTELRPDVLQWVRTMQPIVDIFLVSNNMNQGRIHRIAQDVGVPYFTAAGKPSRRKLREAAVLMNLPHDQVAMVGDRVFTDVLAGNRLGMFTILVDPLIEGHQSTLKQWLRDIEIWISMRLGASF
jgi:uncharacterized protein